MAPVIALAIQQAVQIGVQQTQNWAAGRQSGNQTSAAGARITNEIEAAMDLNLRAFESGTIAIEEFDDNWKALWMGFKEAADKIAQFNVRYATGMVGDRVRGGQFGAWWQGTLHEDSMNWARDKMDSSGFIEPQFQKPWPLKAKYVDTNPYNQLPNALPSVQQALRQAGETGPPPTFEIRDVTKSLLDKITQAGPGTLAIAGLAIVAGVVLLGGKVKLRA